MDQILQGECKPRPFHFTAASGEINGFLHLEQSCTVIELSCIGHVCTKLTPEHSCFGLAFSPGGMCTVCGQAKGFLICHISHFDKRIPVTHYFRTGCVRSVSSGNVVVVRTPQRARTRTWMAQPSAPGPIQHVTVQNNRTLHQAQEKMMQQETRQTRDVRGNCLCNPADCFTANFFFYK